MSSSKYSCVNTSGLNSLGQMAASYKVMSSQQTVTKAGCQAGEHLKMAMQKTIKGEQTLHDYGDVADAITVWSDSENVYVGIPESHQLSGRAHEMDQIYPVAEVVSDLTKQQGDTEQAFYSALAEVVTQ